jgi:hypothetical protein
VALLAERVVLIVASGARNKPASTVLAVNDGEDEVTVMVMKSLNPPKLVKVIVEVPVALGAIVSEAGLAVTPKSFRLEKVAPRVFSMSGVLLPFDMVTTGRFTLIPGVFETTL